MEFEGKKYNKSRTLFSHNCKYVLRKQTEKVNRKTSKLNKLKKNVKQSSERYKCGPCLNFRHFLLLTFELCILIFTVVIMVFNETD